MRLANHDAYTGENDYLPIGDLNAYLNTLREKVGTDVAIEVAAYRSVPVNTVIEIFRSMSVGRIHAYAGPFRRKAL